MKKPNYLKGLRVVLAILIFVPILLFFVDFADVLPDNLHTLLHLQIIPAILGGMAGLVVFQFVLALLFGRIYCSVICPAGVLQDIINRVFCIGKKKKKGVRRFSYHKPMNILRYSILGLTFVLAVFGMIELCTLLDPYSNFGRIANNLFRPVVMWVNNLLADGLARMDNYTLYHVTISNVTVFGVISALVALLVFILMVVFRGRLFCNTLCPVGTLLSLISRYSFFRISFDKEACTHCGNCEHTCKAEAPNSHAHIRRRMYCPGFNGENLFVFALRSAKSVYFLEQIYYFLILHHLYLFVNSGYIFRHVFRRCRDRICSGEGLDCLC